jgi:hypothetical protein
MIMFYPKSERLPTGYLTMLIWLCSCCTLHAQGKWGIRLNQNSDFFSVTYRESTTSSYKEDQVRIGRISAAVTYFSGRYTQELEVFLPQTYSSKPTFPWPHDVRGNPSEGRYSSYAIRYTISRNVYSFTKSLSLSMGGGLNAYFLNDKNVPLVSNWFPVSNYMIGISLNAIPGINLQASKRLSFVLDCPLKILDFYHETVHTKNPAIPVRQQKIRSFETDYFMNAFTVRLGVGYRFGV